MFIDSIPLIRPLKLSDCGLKNCKVLSFFANENEELADELVDDEDDRDDLIPLRLFKVGFKFCWIELTRQSSDCAPKVLAGDDQIEDS